MKFRITMRDGIEVPFVELEEGEKEICWVGKEDFWIRNKNANLKRLSQKINHTMKCIGGSPFYSGNAGEYTEYLEAAKITCSGCGKEYTKDEAEESQFTLFSSVEKGTCKCGTRLLEV